MSVGADAEDLEIDATGFADGGFVLVTKEGHIFGEAIWDVGSGWGDIEMIEEIFVHKSVVASWVGGVEADIFIEVKSGDSAKVEGLFLMEPNEFAVERERSASRGEAEDGGGFFPDEISDLASGSDGGECGRGLNDDFHRKLLAKNGLELGDDVGFEAIDKPGDIVDDVEGIIEDERREIDSEGQARRLIDAVAVEKSSVGVSATDDGEIVAFSSADLGGEEAIEVSGEGVVSADVVSDFFLIEHPIEAAPDFATVDGLRAERFWEGSNRLNDWDDYGDMGGMFVGGIMGVDDFGGGGDEDLGEVLLEAEIGGIAGDGAGVAELEHGGVVAEPSGGPLFVAAFGDHLGIGEGGIRTGAGASGAVGAGDATEPLGGAIEAGDDAVKGHEFEIVLMGADSEMGDSGEGGGERLVVGDINFCRGMLKEHWGFEG